MDTHHTAPASGCPFRLDPAGRNIHTESARLRALGPATPVELPGRVTAWSITDPELATRLLTNPHISKDAHRHWPAFIRGDIPNDWPLRIWINVRNALTAHGPEHTRLRRLLRPAFTPRRINALAPKIEEITTGLLDDLDTSAPGEAVDLRARFAWMLPLLVANTLLGVPDDLHDAFRDRIGFIFATDLPEEQATANNMELYQLLADLVATKRTALKDDVTSALIQARDDQTGSKLTEQELLDSLLLLIGAGHETTVNLLDHGITNLLTHPTTLTLLRNGHASWPDMVEESLRHQAPVANIIMRFPTEDIHDPGTGLTLRRGEPILINYAAIGRDPDRHGETADQFDITRPTRRDHLAFGHGAHYCLGAELARLEARIALRALFDRFPHLTLAIPPTELRPLESFISNGHQTLPAVLRPKTNQGS